MRLFVNVALAAAVGLVWVLVAARLALGDATAPTAALHATTGWWGLGTLVVLGACVRVGRWLLSFVALLPTLVWLGWVVPGTLGARAVPDGPALDIVSANVLMVNPDPVALLDELFSGDPDLVVLQEYSPRFAALAGPWRQTHPYVLERPEEHSFGWAVFSRWPMDDVEESDLAGVPLVAFTVKVDGRPVRVYAVHTLPPIHDAQTRRWQAQLAALAERAAAEPGPLVIAGDLNATRHHPSFRRLLEASGLCDAHAEVGRAAATTWPNGRFPFPPLRLDHLLLGGDVAAEEVLEGSGIGSDHRPVRARLRLSEPSRPR
jgi:endonuclease/exonuclease/phosphatase (EEP) superfamily protein YafD